MRKRRAIGGVTLLETVLVLTLLVAAAAVAVAGFAGWQRTAPMNAGVSRFQTLLRMLRAEAANRGRRVRLTFPAASDSTGPGDGASLDVLWEADPLEAPGAFTPCAPHLCNGGSPAGLVRVLRCRLTGGGADGLLGGEYAPEADDSPSPPITFQPDGTSDSAQVHLVSVDPRDSRVAVVELDGLTGLVSGRVMSWSQYAEFLDEQASPSAAGWARGTP